jgi:hypothetical protein
MDMTDKLVTFETTAVLLLVKFHLPQLPVPKNAPELFIRRIFRFC